MKDFVYKNRALKFVGKNGKFVDIFGAGSDQRKD